jgi:hypothetical protein
MQIMSQQKNSNAIRPGNNALVTTYELGNVNLTLDDKIPCNELSFTVMINYKYFGNIMDYLTEERKVDEMKLLEDIVSGELNTVDHFKRNDNE